MWLWSRGFAVHLNGLLFQVYELVVLQCTSIKITGFRCRFSTIHAFLRPLTKIYQHLRLHRRKVYTCVRDACSDHLPAGKTMFRLKCKWFVRCMSDHMSFLFDCIAWHILSNLLNLWHHSRWGWNLGTPMEKWYNPWIVHFRGAQWPWLLKNIPKMFGTMLSTFWLHATIEWLKH